MQTFSEYLDRIRETNRDRVSDRVADFYDALFIRDITTRQHTEDTDDETETGSDRKEHQHPKRATNMRRGEE